MNRGIIKIKKDDFKLGTICTFNTFDEDIDIKVQLESLMELDYLEQIFCELLD